MDSVSLFEMATQCKKTENTAEGQDSAGAGTPFFNVSGSIYRYNMHAKFTGTSTPYTFERNITDFTVEQHTHLKVYLYKS